MVRSWARVIPNNGERWQTFGFLTRMLALYLDETMTSWGKVPGFRTEIVLPFSLPMLVPTAQTAAVLTPVLNETQDFLYFF